MYHLMYLRNGTIAICSFRVSCTLQDVIGPLVNLLSNPNSHFATGLFRSPTSRIFKVYYGFDSKKVNRNILATLFYSAYFYHLRYGSGTVEYVCNVSSINNGWEKWWTINYIWFWWNWRSVISKVHFSTPYHCTILAKL